MIVKELFARLGIKTDDASVKRADRTLGQVKKSAAAIAGILASGAIVRSFVNIGFAVAKAGDEVAKTAKQIGVNAQSLQQLRFAAGLAGASSGELTLGLRSLQRTAFEAAQGSKQFADDFKRLGVNVRDGNGQIKSAEVLFEEIAGGMQGLTSDTERTALAQSLLGRSGTKLVPLLMQGSEAIAQQRMEAQRLGGVMSEELLRQSEELVDAQLRWSTALGGVRRVIASFLIPALTKLVNTGAEVLVMVQDLLEGTNILQIVLVGVGLVAGSLALVLIGKLVAAFAAVATTAITATGAVGGLDAALLLAKAKAFLLGGAFLVLLGVLFLVADEIVTAFRGGDTLGRRLGETVSELVDWFLALESANPIVNALLGLFQAWVRSLVIIKDTIFAIVQALTGDFSGFSVILTEAEKRRIGEVIGSLRSIKDGAIEAVSGLLPGSVSAALGIGGRVSATAGGGATTVNRSLSIAEVNVTAAPGESATETALNVKEQIVSILNDRDAEDEQILVPAQAGVTR